jgi:hypothetical protein
LEQRLVLSVFSASNPMMVKNGAAWFAEIAFPTESLRARIFKLTLR